MSSGNEILNLFKEQLGNQIQGIARDLKLETEGHGLAYWYFKYAKGMTDDQAKEQICDGGGDLGIDAIEIRDDLVYFYQFKNPEKIEKVLPASEIDKMISGLELILNQKHKGTANRELEARLNEVYSFTPAGYRLEIVVSSLAELPHDSKVKLNSFCEKNSGVAKDLFKWNHSTLSDLHHQFYIRNLPTLEAKLDVSLKLQPYMTKIGQHETYMFDLPGSYLANLYDEHGEKILQQNVRMFEGEKGTNLAIQHTATDKSSSKDFFHFNNGVSIICDSAVWQPFNSNLTLERPQVVNGGQTMRILHKAFKAKNLQDDVHVAVRVITTGKDKDFASNVAINLNNQTRVDNTFLRSNDPRIVQLLHSLSALGWYLERRAGEIASLSSVEISELEGKYGKPFSRKVIPLKDGMQAFVATFYRDPQLAKKDPSKMFTDSDGGSFSQILQSGELTAENFLASYRLLGLVSAQVERFKGVKRKRFTNEDERKALYAKDIGSFTTGVFGELDTSIPQMAIFATGLSFCHYMNHLGCNFEKVLDWLEKNPDRIWDEFISFIKTKKDLKLDKSWPTALKAGSFFKDTVSHLQPEWDKARENSEIRALL